jgi:RNA polymerase sigma factor (sigma-70 family)
MLYSKNVETFVSSNQEEIRKLAHSICNKHNVSAVSALDDIIQEFYAQLILRKILKKYDPKHPSATKISTYLYRPLENLVLAYKNSENRFECRKIGIDRFEHSTTEPWEDEGHQQDRKYYSGNVDVDFENNSYQNKITDDIDGINLDLNLFERYLEAKNKTYQLNRRKNKKIKTAGIDLLEVFRLMREGYTNREIAVKYGVSDMWITTMKHEIKDMLKKFGIVWNYFKTKKRRE